MSAGAGVKRAGARLDEGARARAMNARSNQSNRSRGRMEPADKAPPITFDDFLKVDIRLGTIVVGRAVSRKRASRPTG